MGPDGASSQRDCFTSVMEFGVFTPLRVRKITVAGVPGSLKSKVNETVWHTTCLTELRSLLFSEEEL